MLHPLSQNIINVVEADCDLGPLKSYCQLGLKHDFQATIMYNSMQNVAFIIANQENAQEKPPSPALRPGKRDGKRVESSEDPRMLGILIIRAQVSNE